MHQRQPVIAASSLMLAIILSCCDAGIPAEPAFGPTALASVERPFTGSCETTFDPLPLPPPPVFTQIDTGTCRLTHLGRAAFYSVKEIVLASGTQTTTEASFTAANGDVLRAVGSGTSAPAAPGHVSFTATLTFTGGTGRFTGATGQAHVEGEADLLGLNASMVIHDGWIIYDASERSTPGNQRGG